MIIILIFIAFASTSIGSILIASAGVGIQEGFKNHKYKKILKKIPIVKRQDCYNELKDLRHHYSIVHRKSFDNEAQRQETINAIIGDMAQTFPSHYSKSNSVLESPEDHIKRKYNLEVNKENIDDYIHNLNKLLK